MGWHTVVMTTTAYALHRTRDQARTGEFQRLSILGQWLRQEARRDILFGIAGVCVPKLLVVFSSADSYAARIADAVAVGAKDVRFTEVDVRAMADANASVNGRRRFESLAAVHEYDGIVLAAPGPESGGHELGGLLEWLASDTGMSNTVFALAGGEDAEMLSALARTGGIIVGQPPAADAEEAARKLGSRAAKVIGWIRHALSHESEHVDPLHHHHSR